MKTKLTLSALSLVLAAAGLTACDKASPVAPAGTVLSVTANPTQIGANGTAQIRVVALRANGTPVNPGTQIRMSTNLGTIDPIVEVGDGGIAVGTLRGDGRIGTAEVTATVGADTSAMVAVAVGRAAANISLQASPAQIGTDGGTVELLAVVRDDTGQPLADAAVNFQTEVGTLASRGAIRNTDSNGQVSDRLILTSADLQALGNENSFAATAVVGTSGGSTTSDSVEIRILRCEPVAQFTATAGTNRTVTIVNDSTGEEPLTHDWDFGGEILETGREDDPNPNQITYRTEGPKTIQLTLTNVCGSASTSRTLRVCESGDCGN